jgi:replicative DNA helicase
MPEVGQDISSLGMPQNLEAERALLGSILFDGRLIETVLDLLPASVVSETTARQPVQRGVPAREPLFFSPSHQIIFGALTGLYQAQSEISLVTLGEALTQCGQLDSVGGPAYLAQLEDDIFSLDQVPDLAKLLLEKWRKRCILRAVRDIAQEASRPASVAADLLQEADKRLTEIAQDRDKNDFVQAKGPVTDLVVELEERAKGVEGVPGLRTGFDDLDRMTGGLRPADMFILAARPSMGKTAFCLNIAMHVAVEENKGVAIFSLEMSKKALISRMVAGVARVGLPKIMQGHAIRKEDLEKIRRAGQRIHHAPLYIDDTTSLNVLEMRTRARRLARREKNLSLIIIDYLQLMNGAGRYESRQQEVTEISHAIKALARELEVPIIALSQLSRQVEQRRGKNDDKLPKLSDLRESGAIEQDADIVAFIHRERALEDPKSAQFGEMAKLAIAKQRNGQIGTIDLIFNGQYTLFVSAARKGS